MLAPSTSKAAVNPASAPIASVFRFSFFTSLSCFIKQLEDFPKRVREMPQHGFSGSDPRPSRKGGSPGSEIRGSNSQLCYDVRQQAEEASALDRLGEFALLLLGNGRDAGRNDLAALGNVALQET